jgi:ribonucleoside-triphosphate reductase
MRTSSPGQWWDNDKTYWTDGKYLSMANNSAVYDGRPVEVFMEEWLALVKSKSGERGIFNRQAALKHRPKRRKAAKFGCNPCAEIILRPYQFCNLSIAVARPDDTVETLKRKVRLATVFGVIQSTCTNFRYIRPEWKKNCEEERLLGVDITGHADCPLLRHGAPGRAELLRVLKAEVVEEVDVELSARFGINGRRPTPASSRAATRRVFFDCGSGVSPGSPSTRSAGSASRKDTPVAKFLIDSGRAVRPGPGGPGRAAGVRLPRKAPEGARPCATT